MASQMACLNLAPFAYEDQTQDAPKTPQDTLGTDLGAMLALFWAPS